MRFIAWFDGEKEMVQHLPTTQTNPPSPRAAEVAGELTDRVVKLRDARPPSSSSAPATNVPCLFAHNVHELRVWRLRLRVAASHRTSHIPGLSAPQLALLRHIPRRLRLLRDFSTTCGGDETRANVHR